MWLWLLVSSLWLFLHYCSVDSTGAVIPPLLEPKGDDQGPNSEPPLVQDDIEILRTTLMNYDEELAPYINGKPVIVNATVKILFVPLFHDEDLSLTLELAMEQSWVDKRLDHHTGQKLEVPHYMTYRLWSPHLIFYGAKKSHIHSVLHHHITHLIHPGGKVFQTAQLTVSTQCHFSYTDFPLDHRRCELTFGSSLSANKILYNWQNIEDPLKFNEKALEPQTEWKFSLFRLSKGLIKSDNGLNYSSTTAEIMAFRKPNLFITTYLVTLTIIVVCSWAPTYIEDNLAARVISGVAALGITVGWVARRPLPTKLSLSCYTCIDLYSDFCLILVSLSLLQAVIMIVIKQREAPEMTAPPKSKRRKRRKQRRTEEFRQSIHRRVPPLNHLATRRHSYIMEMKVDRQESPNPQQLPKSKLSARQFDRGYHILSPILLLVAIVISITYFFYINNEKLYR